MSISLYSYRSSVGYYGSLHMHKLSSGISIWLAERVRLLTGRERERDAQRLILLLKACFIHSQTVPGRGHGKKMVAGFLVRFNSSSNYSAN
jgi:hypothetical protein